MKEKIFNKIILLFFCAASFFCLTPKETETPNQKILVTIGKVYNTSKMSIQEKDKQEILSLLQTLVNMTLEKNFIQLPNYVDSELGIYPDLKAHWSYYKLKEEVRNPNSYFEIFFFDKEKLIKEKNSPNVMTVREVLLISEGLKADLFFESLEECEVKILFQKASKYQGDLNNPYFIKRNGKWKIYRLF